MTEAVIRAMRKQKSDRMLCLFILASDIYLFSCKTYLIHNYVISISLFTLCQYQQSIPQYHTDKKILK